MRFFRSLQFWALVIFGPLALTWLRMALIYAVTPIYIDHNESSMVVTAQQWLYGRPLYHAIDGPYLYSLLQGPFDYLWLALALKLCPDPILASKLSGGFWSLSSLALLLVIYWRKAGPILAIAGVGLVAGELMMDLLTPFWDRPDPILIFSSSLGLAALNMQNRSLGSVLLVLAVALAVNCKIHGPLYLLPPLAVWYWRYGVRSILFILGIVGLLAVIPFLLPGVSITNYFLWLRLGAHHPWTTDLFCENLETVLVMVLPLVLFWRHPRLKLRWRDTSEETILLFSFVLAGVLISFPASKVGAGWHHLLPLAVFPGYLFCDLWASTPTFVKLNWAVGVVLVWAFFTYRLVIQNSSYILWSIQTFPVELIQADLRQILQHYPATETQMGVGRGPGYISTFYSPWIYREGTPCVIHIGAYMDMKESGLGAQSLQKSLTTEQFTYWVIPRDGPPFTMVSWYDSGALFDDSVRQAFTRHYVLVASSPYFDIYRANSRER